MLARKSSSTKGKPAPQDWTEAFARLLNQAYSKECSRQGRYFDVYGQIFPEEFLLVVSWLSEKDEYISPITCFLSSGPEALKSEKEVKATQEHFIDLMGLFYDEIFSNEEWNDFEPHWQEVSFKKNTYFYKISRENINLTTEADRLLGEDFLSDEDE